MGVEHISLKCYVTSFQQEKDQLLQNEDLRFISFQIAWVESRCDGFKTWFPSKREMMDYKAQMPPQKDFIYQTLTLLVGEELVQKNTTLTPNLFSSIKQKGTESVIVAVVIAEEAASWQADSHLVLSHQVEGHNNSGTVLLVICIYVFGSGHHLAVNLQSGADGQVGTRRTSVTVDGDGKDVHTRVGNSEDTSLHIVVVTQVKEDLFVDDDAVEIVWAVALRTIIIV